MLAAARLAPRVGVVVHLLEPGLRDVGVDLRGREALVAEQFLDHAQVGAAFEEVRGVGVAKGVGVDVAPRDAVVENAAHVARAEALPRRLKKSASGGESGRHHVVARVLDPEPHGVEAPACSGTMRSLRPLPRTRSRPWREVDAVDGRARTVR